MDNQVMRDETSVVSFFNAKTIREIRARDIKTGGDVAKVLHDLRRGEEDLPSALQQYDSVFAIAMIRSAFADEKALGINLKDKDYKIHVADVAVQRLQEDLSSTLTHALSRIFGVQVAFREMGLKFEQPHCDVVAEGLYNYFEGAARCTTECLDDVIEEVDFLIERTQYGMKNPQLLLPHIRPR